MVEDVIYVDEKTKQAVSEMRAMMIMMTLNNMGISDMEKYNIIEKLIEKLQGNSLNV